MDRRERNKQILDSIGNNDGNKEHIFNRTLRRFNLKHKLAMLLKYARQDREKARTNIEIYLDDWAYHHGGITQANVREAMADCVDRTITLHQKKQQQREAAEERQLSGSLMDGFDDGGFGDLPGDGEIEDALIKADPSLKKYR